MSIKRIEIAAKYVADLEKWNGVRFIEGWQITSETLPVSLTYDSTELNNKILGAANVAMTNVIGGELEAVKEHLYDVIDNIKKRDL